MIGAISNALHGMFSASRTVEQAAHNIANAASAGYEDKVELSEEAVTLKIGEHAYKANIAALKAAEDMSGELMRLFDERV